MALILFELFFVEVELTVLLDFLEHSVFTELCELKKKKYKYLSYSYETLKYIKDFRIIKKVPEIGWDFEC